MYSVDASSPWKKNSMEKTLNKFGSGFGSNLWIRWVFWERKLFHFFTFENHPKKLWLTFLLENIFSIIFMLVMRICTPSEKFKSEFFLKFFCQNQELEHFEIWQFWIFFFFLVISHRKFFTFDFLPKKHGSYFFHVADHIPYISKGQIRVFLWFCFQNLELECFEVYKYEIFSGTFFSRFSLQIAISPDSGDIFSRKWHHSKDLDFLILLNPGYFFCYQNQFWILACSY